MNPEIIGNAELYHGDALEILPTLPPGCADMLFADPPYGITDCEWDITPNLVEMWDQFKHAGRNNCAYIFTSTQPFATDLINSNRAWFKYCIQDGETCLAQVYNHR